MFVLLGITIDDKLKFDVHVNNLCSRASSQVNVMYRFKDIFSYKDKKTIYETYMLSNFNYCPVVWHFCGMTQDRQMEKVQERALRFLLNDFKSEYRELIDKSGFDTLHVRRIKSIACEVYTTVNDLNPDFMKDLIVAKDIQYDFL